MPKRIVQDMVPQKRSIREITNDRTESGVRVTRVREVVRETTTVAHPPAKPAAMEPVVRHTAPRMETAELPPRPHRHKEKRQGGSRKAVWVIAIICIALLAAAVFTTFAQAKVSVTPKQQDQALDAVFTAKNAPVGSELGYELIVISKDAGEVVAAASQKQVDAFASGTVVVYNNYSSAVQKLVKGTRIESTKGLIYRTTKEVSVPGKATKAGKVVPGSVEVAVTADKIGSAYNLKVADLGGDFTIPGFKGTDKYTGFYARLKTDMKGGASGITNVVSSDVDTKTRSDLEKKIREQVIKEAYSQKPEGYVLLDGAYRIDFEALPNVDLENKSVSVNQRGTLYGILMKRDAIEAAIAAKLGGGVPSGAEIVGLDDATFAIKNVSTWNPKEKNALTFGLTGPVKAVWPYDETALKADLAGRPTKEIKSILSGFDTIESAAIEVRPFWMGSFPKETSKIEVERVIK
jgi:hypothetical protein